MIAVVATLTAKPDHGGAVAAALEKMAPVCRSTDEPGCLFYQPAGTEDPDVFTVLELYTSGDAVAAHRETPHFAALKTVLETSLAKAPEVQSMKAFG